MPRGGSADRLRTRAAQRRAIRILSLIVGGLIVLAGAAGLVFGVRNQVLAASSTGWTGVDAEVVVSRVVAGYRRHGHSSYAPDVEYAYSVAGQRFVGTRMSFSSVGSGRDPVPSQDVIAHYQVGKRIRVFYDPVDPAQSVITPGPGPDDGGLTIIAGAFLAFGAVVIVLGRR